MRPLALSKRNNVQIFYYFTVIWLSLSTVNPYILDRYKKKYNIKSDGKHVLNWIKCLILLQRNAKSNY